MPEGCCHSTGGHMIDSISIAQPKVNSTFIWKVSLIAGLGGILYGFDMGIIAAALIYVRSTFSLSTQMEEVVVSVVLVGSMLGAVVGGSLADRLGRRTILIWGGILFIAGSMLAPLSPNVTTLAFARTLLGVAIGFTSVTAPVYVSELAPPQPRGMLIGLSLFSLLMGLSVPESPRWLVAHGRSAEAEGVLLSYTDRAGANLLLADIHASLLVTAEKRWAALWTPTGRKALFTASG